MNLKILYKEKFKAENFLSYTNLLWSAWFSAFYVLGSNFAHTFYSSNIFEANEAENSSKKWKNVRLNVF